MKKRFKGKRSANSMRQKPRGRGTVGTKHEFVLTRGEEGVADPAVRSGEEMLQMLEDYDQGNFSRAKARWLFGEWSALAELDLQALLHNPERDRYALLAASAHQQLGDHDTARRYTRMALHWGCPPRLVAQILVAGVHNTLGRAAALKQDDSRAARHFREAVAVVSGPRDADLLSHARWVREMVKLGLLPQAASLVDQELTKTRQFSEPPNRTDARIRILETELDLLQHELSLAQQRQQLPQTRAGSQIASAATNDSERLEWLKKRSVSQLGQDIWVLEQTAFKRGGFFVDFGATDGVLLSNTWLLEKEFGWQGICSEPNPKFFDKLRKNRNCIVSDACIGSSTGKEVEFIFANAFGGIADYAMRDTHGDRRAAYGEVVGKAKLVTVSLHDFLLQHHAPRDVDYLSIDTEGSEYDILASFPFREWSIRLLTVEHNFMPQREQIRELLSSHGYNCTEREWEDWYVLRRDSQR